MYGQAGLGGVRGAQFDQDVVGGRREGDVLGHGGGAGGDAGVNEQRRRGRQRWIDHNENRI